MAQLVGHVVTADDVFRKQIGRLLRAGSVPVSLIDEREPRDISSADVTIVDMRSD